MSGIYLSYDKFMKGCKHSANSLLVYNLEIHILQIEEDSFANLKMVLVCGSPDKINVMNCILYLLQMYVMYLVNSV